jgi:hypothetical protein
VELEELSDGTQCCAKEKCENDGNAKCLDALLPFICAHAFYNIEAKLLGSQELWKREERRGPRTCEEAKCRAAAPVVRKTSVQPLWAFFR